METIKFKSKEYEILKKVTYNLNEEFFLIKYHFKLRLIKSFQNIDVFKKELKAPKFVLGSEMDSIKVIKADKKNLTIIYNYYDGTPVTEYLFEHGYNEEYLKKLLSGYRMCRGAKFELNYLPENYLISGNKLIYTKRDFFKPNSTNTFDKEGIFYWVESPLLFEHLKDLNYDVKFTPLKNGELNKKIVLECIKYW